MAQVLMPQRRESDLDTILKGLQIAGGIYGLYTNSKELELRKAQLDAAEDAKKAKEAKEADETASIWSPGKISEAPLAGHQVSETPIPGAYPQKVRMSPTEVKEFYIKPKYVIDQEAAEKAAQASAIKDSTKSSIEDNQFVFDKIQKFPENDQVKKSISTAEAARSVQYLLRQKNPVIDVAAQTAIIRMSGDNSVITQTERDAYGVTPGLENEAKAALARLRDGQTIDDKARAAIQKWSEMVVSVAQRDIAKQAKNYAGDLAKSSRMKESEILERLSPANYIPDPYPDNSQNNISATSIPGESKAFAAPKDENDDDFLKRYLSK